MGGEYVGGVEVFTNMGALYDPAADSWTRVNPPVDSAGPWSAIGDAASVVLPNGTFMLQCGPCLDEPSRHENAIFNEATLSWTVVQNRGIAASLQDEQGYTLLPDGSVLTIDVWNAKDPKHAERFYQNHWISAGDTTATIAGGKDLCGNMINQYCLAKEVGPAVLRADGSVIAFGATGLNSIYHPPSDPTQPGTWSRAPSFPIFSPAPTSNCWKGTPVFDVADGPAALLPTGNVLVAASPGVYCQPTRFYELSETGALTQVAGTPNAAGLIAYEGRMLELPSGQILFTAQSKDIEIYTPTGTVNPAWAPTVARAPGTITRGTTYTISGTQFNGLSQGAMYGDDAQMATNYPLVRLMGISGNRVHYCVTANPSTMAVATGKSQVSVQFTCGSDLVPGAYYLQVVANGIASAPMRVSIQ
jgi:hypothetical protein